MRGVLKVIILSACLWGSSLSLAFARPVLVLIDMQEFFFGVNDRSTHYRPLIEKHVEILKWARDHDVPVLVFEVEDYNDTLDELKEILVQMREVAFIRKRSDGGFGGTYLALDGDPERVLKDWSASELIVCGINGSHCVKQTVKEALELNRYRVWTSADAVASLSEGIYPDSAWWWKDIKLQTFHSFEDLKKALASRCRDELF